MGAEAVFCIDEWSTALGKTTVYVGVTIFPCAVLSACRRLAPVPQIAVVLVEIFTHFSNSVLRSRSSTPAISPTEVYNVFSQDTTAFAEQIFATPVISPNEVITRFSQDKVQQRLHPQRELYAMSRCQVARSLSHLQQHDCVRWCHHLFLVLPVGVLIVLRLPVSCQQLESDS